MARKKLPKGVVQIANGNFRASITKHGVREWLGTFGTVEDAAAALDARRSQVRQLFEVRGNEAIRERLSPVAFADLSQFAESDNGGVIDTSPGSEFDIWRRAAHECRVDLKPASEFFSWLNEVVFDAKTAQLALGSPGPFVSALRKVEASKVSLAHLNSVLWVAAMERRRMTLDKVLVVAQKVPDFV